MTTNILRGHAPGVLRTSGVRLRHGHAGSGVGTFLRSVVLIFFLTCWVVARVSAQTHFTFHSHTGNNGTIVIPLSSHPSIGDSALATGDEIGVFTPGRMCVGSGVWMGTNLAITIWGDDEQTPEVDGMIVGERMSFRVWSWNQAVEYGTVSATFSLGTGRYAVNGIYSLSAIRASVVGVDEPASIPFEARLYQNYPNPWNPSTTISFSISEESDVSLRLFNTLGEEVMTLAWGTYPAGKHDITVSSGDLASGCYFYRLEVHAKNKNNPVYTTSRSFILLR